MLANSLKSSCLLLLCHTKKGTRWQKIRKFSGRTQTVYLLGTLLKGTEVKWLFQYGYLNCQVEVTSIYYYPSAINRAACWEEFLNNFQFECFPEFIEKQKCLNDILLSIDFEAKLTLQEKWRKTSRGKGFTSANIWSITLFVLVISGIKVLRFLEWVRHNGGQQLNISNIFWARRGKENIARLAEHESVADHKPRVKITQHELRKTNMRWQERRWKEIIVRL